MGQKTSAQAATKVDGKDPVKEALNKIQTAAVAKLPNSEGIAQGPNGVVLDMSMGLGKTCTVLSYLDQKTDRSKTEIFVFVPTEAVLTGSWVKDMGHNDRCWMKGRDKPTSNTDEKKSSTEIVKYASNNNSLTMKVALFSKFHDIAIHLITNKKKTRVVVFDEIHMLWDTFSGEAQAFLDGLDALQPDLVIGMTGTIVSDSFRDFLMTMNVVIRDKSARPSLSLSAFDRKYFKVPYYRALQAWLVPFVTTSIITIISPLFLLEVADVYLSADPVIPYKKYKVRVVQSVLKRVPFFQTRVFDQSITDILKSANPTVYLSKVVYNMLISPFGFLIPVIAFNIAARSRSDITTPNMARIKKDFGKYIVTKRVEYEESTKDTQNTFWKVPKAPDYDVLYPRMLIKRRTVPYSLHQAKMFVRFCLGRLSADEYGKLAGQKGKEKEAQLATDRTSFEHLQSIGLNIGNQTDDDGIKSNPKFQYILDKIQEHREKKENAKVLRVVIYSRFKATKDGFRDYARGKASIDFYERKSVEEGDSSLGVAGFSATPEGGGGVTPKTRVLFLTGNDHTGLDGVRETDLMFVAEPLASYGELLQLRARVARVNSHNNPRDSCVTVYELACVTDWRTKAGRWWESLKHLERDVHYSLRKQMFSQIATPDEVVLKRQKIKQAFIDSLSF